ncbi:hypothetical protein, partial, partial [Parasitella parasitica]
MDGNQPNTSNIWALDNYLPQTTTSSSNDEMLKAYIQQMEAENQDLRNQMDLLKRTTHDKLITLDQRFQDERGQWQHQLEQLQVKSSSDTHSSTETLRRELHQELDSIRSQLASSREEIHQLQTENSTLRTSLRALQTENSQLMQSNTEAYDNLKLFTGKHRSIVEAHESQEKEIASLQNTIERLREETLNLTTQNQTYLETIGELQNTIKEVRAGSHVLPNQQPAMSEPDQVSTDEQQMSEVNSQPGSIQQGSDMSELMEFHSPIQPSALVDHYLTNQSQQQPAVHVNALQHT